MGEPLVWHRPWGPQVLTPDGPWFHGSLSQLKVGDMLRPQSVCGVVNFAEHKVADSVYVTPSITVALMYSCGLKCSTRGAVYKVMPIGEILPDPESPDPLTRVEWTCSSAVVIEDMADTEYGWDYFCDPVTLQWFRSLGIKTGSLGTIHHLQDGILQGKGRATS